MITIPISHRSAATLAQGHLWIFSNEVKLTKPFPAQGTWCWFENNGTIVGTGYVNPHSLSLGRVVAMGRRDHPEEILRERLLQSFERRHALLEHGAARLLFSEADFLPGLVVDWYSGVVLIQSNTAGIDAVLPDLERIVPEIFEKVFQRKCEGLVVRADSSIRRLEGLDSFTRVVIGDASALTQGAFNQDGVLYAADFINGQKTGFFLDQRLNRASLAEAIMKDQKKKVLDLCCYSGGWGLRALKEGAGHVTFVDESAEALALVEKGMTLNGFSGDRARVVKSDVFDFLESNKETYDVVVVDPPAFVKSNKIKAKALKAYEKLNRLSWRRVKEGGRLITCSCSYHVTDAEFMDVLNNAVSKEKACAHVVYRGSQANDHPVLLSMPETHYLKCVGLKKLTF